LRRQGKERVISLRVSSHVLQAREERWRGTGGGAKRISAQISKNNKRGGEKDGRKRDGVTKLVKKETPPFADLQQIRSTIDAAQTCT